MTKYTAIKKSAKFRLQLRIDLVCNLGLFINKHHINDVMFAAPVRIMNMLVQICNGIYPKMLWHELMI